ncbi:hypothetical protein RKE30_15990 [Streptomyces sp. Li-HN-5-11]|uniref:ABC transporter permease subunit n=1 Tax=Streptomyces sp. Li-HN-5-11 TaxID=3075432 RepID=UPI0028B1DBC4|nr:hypothetical protein [Streptomyces sp. Li-HN-5-11]WNM31800.1 hypothetical protein RKE30_15990 [Streptomyces sp. Li-HN-5-11]
MLVTAAVGVLIALPALRLSGIYLALGTAAFAVVLDRWIFNLPAFEVLGVRMTFFDQGSVTVSGPDLFGLHLTSPAQLLVLSAVCLALASVGVAALRRGRFGRRLIALRDSEAAYATLGGRLLVTRQPSSPCPPGSRDWAVPCTACSCRPSPPTSSTSSPGCRSS